MCVCVCVCVCVCAFCVYIYFFPVSGRQIHPGMEVWRSFVAPTSARPIVLVCLTGCLTLAELGRRGLLLPGRLKDGK